MKYKILAILVFILVLFPYISFFKTPFDTQPWALIAASILSVFLLYTYRPSVPRPLQILFWIVAYAAAFLAIYFILGKADTVSGIRALVGYISVAVFAFVAYMTFPYITTKPYIIAIVVWLGGAILQLIFGAQVLAGMLARLSTGGYRGLTSFAPEPALYAAICASFLVLNEIFYRQRKYNSWWYGIVAILLIVQITLTYSGMGLVLMALFAGSKLLSFFFKGETTKDKWLSTGAVLLVVMSVFFQKHALIYTKINNTVPVQSEVKTESRAGFILQNSVTHPVTFVQKDLSISLRLFNPVIAVDGGLIVTHGLGQGLGTKSTQLIPSWLSSLLGMERTFGGQIQGGLVSTIYELGIVGILFTGLILWIVIDSIGKNHHMRPVLLVSAVVIFLPMIFFNPVAFPLFGYMIGVHLYYLYNPLAV